MFRLLMDLFHYCFTSFLDVLYNTFYKKQTDVLFVRFYNWYVKKFNYGRFNGGFNGWCRKVRGYYRIKLIKICKVLVEFCYSRLQAECRRKKNWAVGQHTWWKRYLRIRKFESYLTN